MAVMTAVIGRASGGRSGGAGHELEIRSGAGNNQHNSPSLALEPHSPRRPSLVPALSTIAVHRSSLATLTYEARK